MNTDEELFDQIVGQWLNDHAKTPFAEIEAVQDAYDRSIDFEVSPRFLPLVTLASRLMRGAKSGSGNVDWQIPTILMMRIVAAALILAGDDLSRRNASA